MVSVAMYLCEFSYACAPYENLSYEKYFLKIISQLRYIRIHIATVNRRRYTSWFLSLGVIAQFLEKVEEKV